MGAPLSKQKQFRGSKAQAELIGTLESKGASETMRIFNIRKPKTFKRLLDDIGYQLNVEKSPIANLHGGNKSMFIKLHRETILDCVEIFGKDEVMTMYNLGEDTLERIEREIPRKYATPPRQDSTLEHEVELLKIKITAIAELRKEVGQLKELFGQFVESTANQVGKALLIPLLQSVIDFEGKLPEQLDGLNFEALLTPGFKQKKREKQLKENPLLETIERVNKR